MKNKILALLITIILTTNLASATFISGDIFLNEIGQARFNLETDIPLDIEGLNFDNERITGRTDQLISLQSGIWTFSLNQNEYDNILLDIHLPNNLNTITSLEGNDNIIDTENKIITLVDSGQLNFQISYKLRDTTNYAFLLWIAIIIIIIVASYIYRKIRKKKDHINTILSLVTEQEEKIIDLLMKGPMRQKEIRKKLDIPKASFTRYLINLEKKKLILREGEGKNKVVKLK